MEIVKIAGTLISVYALGNAVYLCFRLKRRQVSWLAAAVLVLTALMTAYGTAVLLGAFPSWSLFFLGESRDVTGLGLSLLALAAVFILERLIHEERVARKIAEQQRVEAQLRASNEAAMAARREAEAARERAELSDRAKSEFLANMSHELRTPLNAIIGFSDLMKIELHGALGDARYLEYVDDIHASGKHLLQIIADILDLSKIEAGMAELKESEVELQTTIEEVVRIIVPRAKAAEVRVEAFPAPPGLRLQADELRLKQVLINLVANAVKFTPQGGFVTLAVRVREDGALEITVTDSGIGIAAEDLPRVMEPFVQVGSAFARKQPGTGLGLPLCKRMIELHGGSLTLESQPGIGTTATVVLPDYRVGAPALDERPLELAGHAAH